MLPILQPQCRQCVPAHMVTGTVSRVKLVAGKPKDGTHLPEGFEVILEDLCPNQAPRPGQRPARGGRTKPKAEPAHSPKRRRKKAAEYATAFSVLPSVLLYSTT